MQLCRIKSLLICFHFRACSEDISVWQREHRYSFHSSAASHLRCVFRLTFKLVSFICFISHYFRFLLSGSTDLALFAGPALERAKNLWLRLHERGFRMTRITYNTLLQALGKGELS